MRTLRAEQIKKTKTILRAYVCGIDGASGGKTPQKA